MERNGTKHRSSLYPHSMKAYSGKRGTVPLILNLDTGGERSTSRPGRFSPAEQHPYSLNKKLGGPQSTSWWDADGNNRDN